METVKISLVRNEEELELVASVLIELRRDYELPELKEVLKEQFRGNYQVAFAASDQGVLAVAGFVISKKLAWKKHLYVDDLVVTESAQSSGVGGLMIDWLKTYAKSESCEQMHLDSGVQRFAAHKFYLNNGFKIASHHFSIANL